MTLQLIESHDVIRVESIVLHVFGDPGVWKSSLGNTASGVVMLDFDKGAHRSIGRKRVVRVERWKDMEDFLDHEWASEAQTFVIDTVGRALDYMIDEIVASNAKWGSVTGGLSQQGWGVLKQRFATFFREVRNRKKDVVLLSHSKVDKDQQGNKSAVPDIPGGSAGEVFKVSDAMAYMSVVNGKRVLDFNACEAHPGKNPVGWDLVTVPELSKHPAFLAEILSGIKDRLNSMSEEQAVVLKGVADFQAYIETLTTPEEFTAGIEHAKKADHPAVREQAKGVLHNRAKALGFEYDKTAKAYVAAKVAATA